FAEAVDAGPVDELHCTSRPRRKADAEDRSDVRVVHAHENAFREAAGGLDRLAIEQAVLELLHVPGGTRFFEELFELRPKELLAPGFLRVLVEACARRAPVAIELLDHALDE